MKKDKIKEELERATHHKEIARKSNNYLDEYLKAAEHFKKAVDASQEVISNIDDEPCEILQFNAFKNYYLFETYDCLSTYHYEKRNLYKALDQYKKGLAYINKALSLVKYPTECTDSEILNYLKSFVDEWNYMEISLQGNISAAKGRKYWDEDKPIEALDYFREASKFMETSIELSREGGLKPAYERIAVGNFIGMNANMASSLAKIQLSRGKEQKNRTTLNNEQAIELVKHTLRAAKLARKAFENNPEWMQYKKGALHMEKIVSDFLKQHDSFWKPLYLHFENDEYVKMIMKKTDLVKYKEVKSDFDITDNKSVRIWLSGSFFLLAFLTISFVVYTFIAADLKWWETLISISAIEVIVLIVGALTLRSINMLSEENFVDLIKLAFNTQYKFIRKIFSKENPN